MKEEINDRLAAIEATQREIIDLLLNRTADAPHVMTLKEAALYSGFSPTHFRRLAVEQRIVPYSRPSEQQKGKLLFRKSDLDAFIAKTVNGESSLQRAGRKRKSIEAPWMKR